MVVKAIVEDGQILARGATDFLTEGIISGDLKPGDLISVPDIPNSGPYPEPSLREGLSRLLGPQLVVDGDDGYQVAVQSEDELADIRHTRYLLEGVALRDSILNGDEAWEARVTESLAELSSVPPAQWLTYEAAKMRKKFHQALISASSLKRVAIFLDGLYDQCAWYTLANNGSSCSDFEGQKELAEAALARDIEAANERLRLLLFPVRDAEVA